MQQLTWEHVSAAPPLWEWEELPVSVRQTLLGVVQTLEAKDSAGPGHSARVTAYGTRLARAAGLSPSEILAFGFGTLIHDIGKIAISDGILQKPGRLSALEYKSVQAHPLVGGWLLRPVLQDVDPRVLDVVLHHHERFDGTGYPHALTGTEIPLWARLCCIADAWDVMTSPRVYRSPFTVEEAVAELRRCSGTQFDPDLTALFIDWVVPETTVATNSLERVKERRTNSVPDAIHNINFISDTRLIYLESPSTMLLKLQDLAAVAALAKRHGIRTAIDNSYCTMLLQRPLDLGIDYSVYSATKYLNGHSDVVAGAVVARRELIEALSTEHQLFGGIIGPFEAWLIARGLRTMPARLRQHQQSAAQIVDYLVKHPKVAKVHYPYHPSHPQFELARRQMKGASSLLSFEIDSPTLDRMRTLANAVRYFGLGVSWGGHESLLTMPLIYQSRSLPPERWTTPGLVRLHVGLEAPEDLLEDLDQALAKI